MKKKDRWIMVRRIKATGYVSGKLMTVIYADREGKTRIISARKASKSERHIYEQAL
jgi:uncharacterized DUF497 family protein